MKADASKQHRKSEVRAAPPSSWRRPEAPPAPDEPEAAAGADEFEEVPTVANRAAPTEGSASEADPATRPAGEAPGAYRMVRPTVSDFVAQPVATKPADPAGSSPRAILGTTRRPR